MTRVLTFLTVALVFASPARAQVPAGPAARDSVVQAWLKQALPGWLDTYRHLHAHPELSLREVESAKLAADALRAAGFTVHTGVGGHGVVGLLDNGKGPTLLIRGDMDALPVTEQTGLAYASKVRVKDDNGRETGVMHACGHDVHLTNLLATAAFLAAHRELWVGRLMVVAQPAEEIGQGASNMIGDRLFQRFGRPDFALALHVSPALAAGRVGYVSGWAFANVDTADITLFGRGGHGARPHQAADPIVAAAQLVTALQTLVSRRVDPREPAVVTVGSIHAGHKHSVIPDTAHLQLTVRSYSDDTRRILVDGIRQLSRDVCDALGCVKPPSVTFKKNYTPALYNDPGLTAKAAGVFRTVLGDGAVAEVQPTMGGEDFGRYPRELKIPGLLFRLGAVPPRALARSRKRGGTPLPSLHSSAFAPDIERALPTGVRAMAGLALSLLEKP